MCLAVPGKIVSIEGTDPIFRCGKVNFGGIQKQINLAYVPEAKIGDYVLVHVGFAISTIDEAEAQEVFGYLRQLGELSDLEESSSQ
jgi:hydrogenase expression/formation protein HypC